MSHRSIAFMAALAAAGCSSSEPTPPPPPPTPATITVLAGSEHQSGTAGLASPVVPGVTVTSSTGAVVPGATVTFTVTGGGGSVASTSAVTNASGVATAGSWTLGTIAGLNYLVAAIPAAPSVAPVTFDAAGDPGPPASIAVAPANAAVLSTGTNQLTYAVFDQFGNEIPAAPVGFQSVNTNVATVSTTGLISGVALGTTTINVTSGAFTKAVPLIVLTATKSATGLYNWGIAVSSLNVAYNTYPSDNAFGRFDLPSLTLTTSVPAGTGVADVTFSADGSKAYIGSIQLNRVYVVNVATNTITDSVTLPDEVWRVRLSTDGSRLYAGTSAGLYAINTTTLAATHVLGVTGPVNGLAINPVQNFVYATTTYGYVYEVNTSTDGLTRPFLYSTTLQEAVVSPDGTRIFLTNEGGLLDIRSTSTFARLALSTTASSGFGIAISGDGARMVMTRSVAAEYAVIDPATGEVMLRVASGVPRRVVFDGTSKNAIISNEQGWITVLHWP